MTPEAVENGRRRLIEQIGTFACRQFDDNGYECAAHWGEKEMGRWCAECVAREAASQLLASVEERDRLKAEVLAWKSRFALQTSSGWQTPEEAKQLQDEVWQRSGELVASLKAENKRLQQMFAEIGKVLKTGGMDDPAFLAGAVQACVEIADQRGQSVRTLKAENEQLSAELSEARQNAANHFLGNQRAEKSVRTLTERVKEEALAVRQVAALYRPVPASLIAIADRLEALAAVERGNCIGPGLPGHGWTNKPKIGDPCDCGAVRYGDIEMAD